MMTVEREPTKTDVETVPPEPLETAVRERYTGDCINPGRWMAS